MANKFMRLCAALVMTWLACLPVHTTAASGNKSPGVRSAPITRRSVSEVSAAGCANPHTVRKGDTLSGIARSCGVSVTSLKKMNGLRSDVITIGQTLATGSSSSAPAKKAPARAIQKKTPPPAPTPVIESPPSHW